MAQQYTREELKDMAQQAEDAGDTKGAQELSELYWNTPETPDPMASLPDPLRAFDDATTVSMDAFTRGFGGGDAARGARERLPAWAEVPADIAGGIAGSPYRVSGKLASMGVGALEGAADTYGHQEDWIPDAEGAWDIAKGAATGSGLGLIGAKAGEMVGGLWDRARRKGLQMFKGDDELTNATDEAFKQDPKSARTNDLTDRSLRVNEIRNAQGKTRDEFGTMLKGMNAPPVEQKAIDAITEAKPGKMNRLAQAGGRVSDAVAEYFPKHITGPALAAETFFGGGIPWASGSALLTSKAASTLGKSAAKRANYPTAKEIDDLLMAARDPTGRDHILKSEMTDAMRDALAKFGIGTGKNIP